MRLLKFLTAALIYAICAFPALAQDQPVFQTGTVTAGHAVVWVTNGVVGDGAGVVIGSYTPNDLVCVNATGGLIDCGIPGPVLPGQPYVVGGLLYTNTTTTVGFLADVASGSIVCSAGVGFPPTWCLPGSLGLVSSVANSDGTLTISPTTGSVVASLALGHANTWSGVQIFGNVDLAITDASAAHQVYVEPNSSVALTADRVFTLDLVNAARTLKLGANLTIATDPGAVTGALKSNGSGTFTQAACADLSNSAAGCSAAFGTAAGQIAQGGVVTAGGPTGSATVVPVISYNAAGQITTITTATIAPPFSAITGTISVAQVGGSGASHAVPVDVAGTITWKVVPDCTDATGNHINYTQSTDAWSCGTTVGAAAAGTLTGSTLASGVTASSLTSLGTITSLTATTINAFTLGGTIAGGGNQINNVIIGTSTPLAGSFTTVTATTSITTPLDIGGSGTTGTQKTFQTTTGNGTTDAFAFVGGNNGAKTFMTITDATTPLATMTGQFVATGAGGAFTVTRRDNSANAGALYSAAGNFQFFSNGLGGDAMSLDTSGNATIAGTITATLATDNTHTDRNVCQDTTSKTFFFGSGAAGICLGTSSVQFKHDVMPLAAGLDEIMKLEAVSYRLNADHGDPDRLLYGFTAEQGYTALPDLVGLDAGGHPQTFDYMGVVPALVRSVQELKADNDNLRAEVAQIRKATAR